MSLDVTELIGFGVSDDDMTLLEVLQGLGLTSNLKLCLDAGDSASYSSGQSWLDRSGNGYDFFRGATSSATTDDPTFNGTPGGKSAAEYWSFDGGDYFTYDTTNETWMQNIHKDSAKWWMLAWVRPVDFAANRALAGDNNNNISQVGFRVNISTAARVQLQITNGSGVAALTVASTGITVMNAAAWNMVAIVVDEANTSVDLGINAEIANFAVNYTSPSAASAFATLQLAANGANGAPLSSGDRLGMIAMGEGGVLTNQQVADFYDATRGRYGL